MINILNKVFPNDISNIIEEYFIYTYNIYHVRISTIQKYNNNINWVILIRRRIITDKILIKNPCKFCFYINLILKNIKISDTVYKFYKKQIDIHMKKIHMKRRMKNSLIKLINLP